MATTLTAESLAGRGNLTSTETSRRAVLAALEALYSRRACWICDAAACCKHREPQVYLAELLAALDRAAVLPLPVAPAVRRKPLAWESRDGWRARRVKYLRSVGRAGP